MKKQFPHEPAEINYKMYSKAVTNNLLRLLFILKIKSAKPSGPLTISFAGGMLMQNPRANIKVTNGNR
jgi:hypothetical protein